MPRIDHKNFCTCNGTLPEDKFFRVSAKGGAAAFAASCPAENCRVPSVCERAVMVSTDSFIRRPSLCDEAMEAITGFVNEGIYGMQEPGKESFCSAAVLYIFRDKARCVTMGSSVIFYFSDNGLTSVFHGNEDVLPGKSLRSKFVSEPEFELKKGRNSFLIVSSRDKADIDSSLIKAALQNAEGAEKWIDAVSDELKKYKCSALAIDLPPKKPGIADLLHI